MTPAAWERAKTSFEKASQLSPQERLEYLGWLRGQEPETANLVCELLEASEEAQGFLEKPPWKPLSHGLSNKVFSEGQLLGDRFTVEAFLGSGGAGEVYRAMDLHRETRVALKTVRSALTADAAAIAALQRELNIASRISHPNVCRLFDIVLPIQGQGPSFLTMELIDGETLAARIHRGRLGYSEAYVVLKQLVDGLAAAHRSGVIHRDLKSGNVMLAKTESHMRVVVMDFGLAREIRTSDKLATALSSDLFVGTPAYMAPEQLLGKRATIASDVYSLGVIMFEMITKGVSHLRAKHRLPLHWARLNRDAPRPASVLPGLDAKWDRTISACLERDQAKRPRSAEEVVVLLLSKPPFRIPRKALFSMLRRSHTARAVPCLFPLAFALIPSTPKHKRLLTVAR